MIRNKIVPIKIEMLIKRTRLDIITDKKTKKISDYKLLLRERNMNIFGVDVSIGKSTVAIINPKYL